MYSDWFKEVTWLGTSNQSTWFQRRIVTLRMRVNIQLIHTIIQIGKFLILLPSFLLNVAFCSLSACRKVLYNNLNQQSQSLLVLQTSLPKSQKAVETLSYLVPVHSFPINVSVHFLSKISFCSSLLFWENLNMVRPHFSYLNPPFAVDEDDLHLKTFSKLDRFADVER